MNTLFATTEPPHIPLTNIPQHLTTAKTNLETYEARLLTEGMTAAQKEYISRKKNELNKLIKNFKP